MIEQRIRTFLFIFSYIINIIRFFQKKRSRNLSKHELLIFSYQFSGYYSVFTPHDHNYLCIYKVPKT